MIRRGWTAAVVGSLIISAGLAQSQPAASQWKVVSSPAVDLWYYGLAAVGFTGAGTLSYYDRDFVTAMSADLRGHGGADSALETGSTHFRDTFRSDTVFEALHFLPLYYADDDGTRLIASLRSLSVSGNSLAQVFPSAIQRATLSSFANALDAVRQLAAQSHVRAAIVNRQSIDALDRAWRTQFMPALSPALVGLGIRRGVLIVSPAIAAEGRIVRNGDEAIIAVGSGHSGDTAAPLYSAVRELCFPIVERIQRLTSSASSRVAAIELSNRAAVRCGAILLDASSATMGTAFRRAYLNAPTDERSVLASFDSRYPLPTSVDNSLRAEVARFTAAAAKR